MTAGVVLAAGSSRRMPGTSKLDRRWTDDATVLDAVLAAAGEASLSPVVVVGSPETEGADDAEGTEAGSARRVGSVAAPPGGGRADSLAAGLEALEPGPVIILLGDEPGVRAAVIGALDEHCRASGADAGRVGYADRPGHPVWLGPTARAVAIRLRGDAPVWEAVSRPPLRAVLLRVHGLAPIDVDTPAALARARRRHEPAAGPEDGA